jgi:periplasmic protein TonB
MPHACDSLDRRRALRGPEGAFGIIEAFASQARAFAHEQIKSLEDLGEIAEAALRPESRATISTPAPAGNPVGPPEILAASTARPERTSAALIKDAVPERKRPSWILAAPVALVVMALASAAVWWTGHGSVGESASQSTAQTHTAPDTPNVAGAVVLPFKPSPTAGREKPDWSRTNGVVRNAASIQPVEDPEGTRGLSAPKNIILPAASQQSPLRSLAAIPAVELPSVVAATAGNSEPLRDIVSAPPLPRLEITISQGVKEANLIHQVAPVYPPGALSRRLEGAVHLEASIAEDGTIGTVKVLSGQPLLAAAAATAVQQWRYTPCLLNGKPISVQKKITVDFKLH